MNLSLPPERAEGGSEIRMKASRIISVLLTVSLTVNFCGCSGPFDFGKKEIKEFTAYFDMEGTKLAARNDIQQIIAEKTGASTATISRVNRARLYGSDGYGMVFERLEKKDEA